MIQFKLVTDGRRTLLQTVTVDLTRREIVDESRAEARPATSPRAGR